MRTTLVMRKKSAIMASTIAVVLTTSVLVFALPNQVFAQAGGHGGWLFGHSGLLGQTNVKVLGQEITQGIKTQVGKGLEFAWVIKGPGHPGLGYHWDPGHLGDVCLSCWGQALAVQQGRHP